MTKPNLGKRERDERNERRLARFQNAAKEAGVKLTHQRLEIFRVLASTEEHPNAETVYRAVQELVPTVSLDTVYRTLWMLHDLGLVRTLGPGGRGGPSNSVRFDVNAEHHHHYVCVRCGSVRDFSSRELDELPIRSAVKGFGTIVDAQVEVRGLCEDCQGRTKKKEHAGGREGKRR